MDISPTNTSQNTLSYSIPIAASDQGDDTSSQLLYKVVPSAMQMLMTDSKFVAGSAIEKVIAPKVSSLGGWLGIIGKGFGFLGAATGAFDLIANWGKSTPVQGAASGAAIGGAAGSFVPGVGTAIGGALGGLLGGIAGSVHNGKQKDQKARDAVRASMVEAGFLDREYSLLLANGLKYNMGIDGGPKAALGGRRPYELDFDNPLVPQTVAWLNPITGIILEGNEKLKSDFTGYLTNAAITGATSLEDTAKNVVGIMKRLNLTPGVLQEWAEYQKSTGKLSNAEFAVHMQSIAVLGRTMSAR